MLGAAAGSMPYDVPAPTQSQSRRGKLWPVALVALLFIGLVATGSYFLFSGQPDTAAVATSADPSSANLTANQQVPLPTEPSAASATPSSPTTAATPTTTPAAPPDTKKLGSSTPLDRGELVQIGNVLRGVSCAINDSEAIGELDEDGRLRSKAGLSIPKVDGFSPIPFLPPVLRDTNSLDRQYEFPDGAIWYASATVGTLDKSADDTYTAETAAVRVVECLLGSEGPYAKGSTATVKDVRNYPVEKVFRMDLLATLPGMSVPEEHIQIVTAVRTVDNEQVVHVALATSPASDPASYQALSKALNDLMLG
ncbi:MAG: hypothetical protein CSA64_01500 [Arachnia propionica]|nr:MAG: hypothetical protein CSA64_01500 [Arachnia propionica]